MDEIFIKKVLNGDIDAFQYFVKQYKDKAYNVALSILKNEFDAKDAVQEAFIIAYKKLNSFKGKSRFFTWFCRIVINESTKKAKEQEREQHISGKIPDITVGEATESLFSMEEDQQKYFIDLALKSIPSKEALVLNLFYLEELSILEVSGLTGWSESNVKVILFRARKNMYSELSKILKTEKNLLL